MPQTIRQRLVGMMQNSRRGVSCLFLLLFLFMNTSILSNHAEADGHFMDALGIIEPRERVQAPDFTLKDLNGSKVRLRDYRGKIVFLNFWATWCPPCREEMPSMDKVYNEFRNKDFVMLAINLQENAGRVKAFKERFRLNFPILLDSDGEVGLDYAVRSIPTSYLVDREGYLIGRALGARNWASEEAFKLFDHLLNSAPPPR